MVRLSRLELRVIEALWKSGKSSIRELREGFPARARPAYSTIQTVMYRLEGKRAVKRTERLGNADIFEPAVTRGAVYKSLVDDFLRIFGGRTEPLMSHLIESGRLTLEDIHAAERLVRATANRKAPK